MATLTYEIRPGRNAPCELVKIEGEQETVLIEGTHHACAQIHAELKRN